MAEPENRRTRVDDPWLRVPASARPADRHRFSESDGDDEQDEDIEFLHGLAQEVVTGTPQVTGHVRPIEPRRFTVPADEALELFRTTEVERPRPRVLSQIRIEEVEMDDLLEQLSTTAAALRRRKAA